MFASNRHCKLIERKNSRYSQILFQEFKIANFTRLSFTSLPLLKLLEDVFAPATIKAHFGLWSEYLKNDLQCKKKFCWILVTLLSPSRPSKDSTFVYCPISSLMFVLLCAI